MTLLDLGIERARVPVKKMIEKLTGRKSSEMDAADQLVMCEPGLQSPDPLVHMQASQRAWRAQ